MESSNLIQSEKESLILKFKLRIKRLLYIQYSPRYIRLKGDLQAYRENLLVMKGKNKSNENNWIDRALVLCEKVDNELKKIGIDEGWKLMHAAERQEVYCSSDIRKAMVIQLREECGKLSDWRRNSILKIIGVGDKKDKDIKPELLEKALKIRDEFYHSLYYTNRLTRGQFNWLFVAIVIWILFILIYICSVSGLTGSYKMGVMNFNNMIGVLLFGLLGATTSSIFHFRNSQSSSRIPEIISNTSITMSRIFVGTGFSIFIFILLNSNIVEVLNLFSFKLDSCYEFFTIAFVSGFSERLALKSIQKIIGKKE